MITAAILALVAAMAMLCAVVSDRTAQGFVRALALNILSWAVEAIGLIVVPLGLPFLRKFTRDDGREIERLPAWLLPWDNAFDGANGDHRLWWHHYCLVNYGKPATHPLCQYRWLTQRNPANYFSRNICGVDVSTLRIVQVAGNISDEGSNGFFVLKGMAANGKVYLRIYAECRLSATHGLMLDVGYKVKLSHNGRSPDAPEVDRIKGIVLTVSPWKELT